MNSEAKQFHCPNCYADLKFSPDRQMFTCEYCRSAFTEAEVLEFQRKRQMPDNEENQIPPEPTVSQTEQSERDNFEEESRLYSCPSCGAEIVCDGNTAAAFCYYCHNPVILKGRVDGKYKPSKVLPFAFDRDQAVETFQAWAKKKKFAPKDLLSTAQLDKLTGLYVPFWVANSSTSAYLEAIGENVRTWTSGNYRYTEVSKYRVIRDALISYEGIPADGSKKIEDQLMEAIEPFDYSQAKPFNMAYLSGFYADKYDVNEEQVFPRIRERMYANNEAVLNSTMNYQRIKNRRQDNSVDTLSFDYMLLPVWFMTFDYKGKLWEYAINGQSGKVAGELPVSKKKLFSVCGIVAALMIAAVLLGGYFLR